MITLPHRLMAMALVAIVGVDGGVAAARSQSGQVATRSAREGSLALVTTSRPFADAAALPAGTIAFVSRGSLWLLDSTTQSLHELMPAANHPQAPSFSADGRWLEFTAKPLHASWGIWLARRDGRDLHRITGRDIECDGWSPRGHRIAFDYHAGHALTAVAVAPPQGTRRVLAYVAGVTGVAWSPDGRAVAVAAADWSRHSGHHRAIDSQGRTTLTSYTTAGGVPTSWFSRDSRTGRLFGMNELRLIPAGWLRGRGIGFWVVGDGAVLSSDQMPLGLIRAPGAKPQRIGSTLLNRQSPSLAASGDSVAIVDETVRDGFGRQIWQHKRVTIVSPGEAPRRLPAPRHTVTLDPAWSPGARLLAYVVAPSRASAGFPQGVVRRWYAAHRLAIYRPADGRVRYVAAAHGASAPIWSRDGADLLFVAYDALWSWRLGSVRARRVVAPLFAPSALPAYYGQVDWAGRFAWSDGMARVTPR